MNFRKTAFFVIPVVAVVIGAAYFFVISVPRLDPPEQEPSAETAAPDQRAADLRERPEGRVQTSEGRGQESEVRGQRAEVGGHQPDRSSTHPDIRLLRDASASLADREKAIFRLARSSPELAFAELLRLIESDQEDSRLKAAAAQALASLGNGRSIAEKLARGDDAIVARGAVRGLAALNDESSARFMADLLFDTDSADTVRMEAALSLSGMDSPQALEALLRATYSDIDSDPSEPVFHDVLVGLVRNHYGEASHFINGLLEHPQVETESKLAALNAMAEVEGDGALASLLRQARNESAEIREAAIWAIAGHDQVHQARDDLLDLLNTEESAWVRSGLYAALRYQDQIEIEPLWDQVAGETSLSTKLDGLNLIAENLTDETAPRFESEIVPELRRIATEDSSRNNRINAILALGRAKNSPGARQALELLQHSNLDTETRRAAEVALRR